MSEPTHGCAIESLILLFFALQVAAKTSDLVVIEEALSSSDSVELQVSFFRFMINIHYLYIVYSFKLGGH